MQRSIRFQVLALVAISSSAFAQRVAARPANPVTSLPPTVTQAFDSLALTGVRWRELGPYRGGRSVAVAGSVARPNEYYQGTTGGGVFKTTDGGQAWFPVTDRWFGGTIGAIRVAPSNPDVVYVGGGEFPIRGNVSHGDGVWKSTDGGGTWTYKGLRDTKQIGDVVVHPANPDLVYVGALGHVFGPNAERGVYRSRDGGASWQKVLFRNDSTGVVDLVMDPNNPNVLYAGFWQAHRTPWMLVSGGAGSGMFKTTDGGDTWTEITRNPGLPVGIWGNIGISVSGANSSRVYAIIEAGGGQGGVYVSDDAGATWRKTNGESSLTQRAWYYMKIHADPKNQDVVYVNNVAFQKSTDGGKTFRPVQPRPPHGDSHDLWIASDNSNRMIEADDGGASVTNDGGRTWSAEDYATAQFYHVITTNHFPYKVCGAQQDNSTLCGPSRGDGGTIGMDDWDDAGGGESGHIAARHDDPDILYAGSYGGLLTRKDMRTGLERNVNPWPDNPMGHPVRDLKYRFQWTFPIVVSRHNSNVVYATSQHVHRTTNGGERWTVISPDLSYNDRNTQGNSGGPITLDQTSVEYYGVVFALDESPRTAGLLWAGTDDGRVWITRNAGTTWREVTPKDMVKYTRVSSVHPSAHAECTAYVAGNRFQLDDDRPYLWKTSDCGASWERIDTGIAPNQFTRVVREDPERRGLLFAGTERGVWFSPNDGRTWQPLQLNLPIVPVHDLQVKEGDLVVATHGRSFWVLDNVSSLRQLSDAIVASDAHLFKPRDAYRASFGGGFGGGGGGGGGQAATGPQQAPVNPVAVNPPNGPVIQYWLKDASQEVTLTLLDSAGNLIRSFSSRQDSMQATDSVAREMRRRTREDSLRAAGVSADSIQAMRRTPDAPAQTFEAGFRPTSPPRVQNRSGVNTFVWDMRYPAPSAFRGMILWAAGVQGPLAPPGTYMARLAVGGRTIATERVRLLPDPRVKGVTAAQYAAQFRFIRRIASRFGEANDAVKTIRFVRSEIDARRPSLTGAARASFDEHANALMETLTSVEDSIYQTKSRSGQDPLNYPIRLNNKIGALMGVAGSSDGSPTAQTIEVFDVLNAQLERELGRMRSAITTHLPPLNAALRGAGSTEIAPRAVDVAAPAPATRVVP